MKKLITVILVSSALVWGGMTFIRSVSSNRHQVPEWVAQRKAGNKYHQEIARALGNLPTGLLNPDFCSFNEATAGRDGGFKLYGIMQLPILKAGDRVNAFMKTTQWELYDVIKQSDAAALFYHKGNVEVTYTFLLNSNAPNECLLSWKITDRQ